MAQTTDRSSGALTALSGTVTLRRTATVYETATVEVAISVPTGLTVEQIRALLAAVAYAQYQEGAVDGEWQEEDSDTLAVESVGVTIVPHSSLSASCRTCSTTHSRHE